MKKYLLVFASALLAIGLLSFVASPAYAECKFDGKGKQIKEKVAEHKADCKEKIAEKRAEICEKIRERAKERREEIREKRQERRKQIREKRQLHKTDEE